MKAARLKRAWTQAQLSSKTGVSRNLIAYYETQKWMRGDLAARFDKVFGGSKWRGAAVAEAPAPGSPVALRELYALQAQIAELMKHVINIERKIAKR